MLRQLLQDLPLIAILRGIRPQEVPAAADALTSAGFRIIEIPLNSPEPLESLRHLAGRTGLLVGAGTVLSPAEVEAVAAAGGRLMVAPNADREVIAAAKRLGMVAIPGVATPTEAFAALAAGADGLKMFPAEILPPKAVKAWRAVLPASLALLPVGGVTPESMADYLAAGADGFGLGSALYKPGMSAVELGQRAKAFATAYRALKR
ncbi:MAG TPA: 2-dehydro-3-deoxy-6-phosphogalactonate aldolase [Dongiaceae bacterium]|jgi:2-dehydro-3-deoxyphosphogalactonate aldolase|nr:2-dehydro-3-deoxy-6-phosphogalactonate aldolase [Dongiaceae bacterium]